MLDPPVSMLGIPAMEKVGREIANWPGVLGEAATHSSLQQVLTYLNSPPDLFGEHLTAGLDLYLHFLQEAGDVTDWDFGEAMRCFENSIQTIPQLAGALRAWQVGRFFAQHPFETLYLQWEYMEVRIKLHFIRHGESSANILWIFSNQEAEHPLTEPGREQARTRAHSLGHLPADRIYASPILRARQTAEILGAHLGVPVEITPALREWDVGIYEGTSDPQGWASHQQVQDDWFNHQKYESKMPGGESFLEIQARFVPFIQSLVQDPGAQGKEFILVSHGGLYRAMLPVILANIDSDFIARASIPYTAWIEAESGPGGLQCTAWCGEPVPIE